MDAVGTWKSSRLSTPLLMRENGDWEIRSADDGVLQYGVWRLDGQRLIWTVRDAYGQVTHDANTVLSAEPRRFVLAERDGSKKLTREERIEMFRASIGDNFKMLDAEFVRFYEKLK